MQYKIAQVRVKNFKCFDDTKFYEFIIDDRKNPIILSGPNGFGKTTFFDAIELVFSKNITRLETSIENKATNLGKNILLNKADKDGYVVVTLKNEESNYLTIFVIISNSVHKLSIDKAVKYGIIEEQIETEDIDNCIAEYVDWKDDLAQHEVIRYSQKHFNVYYYVSQAESVHFLKRTITDRKDAMNVLLNTTFISDKVNLILDKLIGKRSNAKDVIVNEEISKTEKEIDDGIAEIKKIYEMNRIEQNEDIEYEPLLCLPSEGIRISWDEQNLTGYTVAEINDAMAEINALHSYADNQEDYARFLWNAKIKKIINGKAIRDYVEYYKFISDNKVNLVEIENNIRKWDELIEIFTYSSLFRSETVDLAKYKRSDLVKLNTLIPELIDFDLNLTDNIVDEVTNLKNLLSGKQEIIGELESARNALMQAKEDYDEDSSICPFCSKKYANVNELKIAFDFMSQQLEAERGASLNRIKEKETEFLTLVKSAKKKVLDYLGGYEEEKIKKLILDKSNLREFVGDTNRIADLEFLSSIIENIETLKSLDDSQKEIAIQRIVSNMMKSYNNSEFMNEYQKYNYQELIRKYEKLFEGNLERLRDKRAIDKKLKYLMKFIWEKDNLEIVNIKALVKQKIVYLEKLKRIRKNLDELQKLYNSSINEYKNLVLKKLRVPLLIYTGKILQDYQNGLGVFINKNEMRFVSTGDAKHDILNTFSSGQLSGFVLAFLFSMNKQYIKDSTDDIGFILIDDPVQTMDDINISSLIEVLRNDFADKQIILSTHETDKENYILYKFYKYNQIGQSFNVKEQLYGI